MNLIDTIDYYAYIKPKMTPEKCGDTGLFIIEGNVLLFALLDVLGHGATAYKVAEKARIYLESNFNQDLVSVMKNLHQHLLGTIGLVGNLASLNLEDGTLSYVGIGNVRAKVYGNERFSFVNRDGIVGYRMPEPKLKIVQINRGDSILMFSDGISNRDILLEEDLGFFNDSAKSTTTRIVTEMGNKNDDKACLIVKY